MKSKLMFPILPNSVSVDASPAPGTACEQASALVQSAEDLEFEASLYVEKRMWPLQDTKTRGTLDSGIFLAFPERF